MFAYTVALVLTSGTIPKITISMRSMAPFWLTRKACSKCPMRSRWSHRNKHIPFAETSEILMLVFKTLKELPRNENSHQTWTMQEKASCSCAHLRKALQEHVRTEIQACKRHEHGLLSACLGL